MTKDLEARVSDLEKRVSALEEVLHTKSSASEEKMRNISVDEFLLEKRPKSATDVVLAMAVYCEGFCDADSFSAKSLSDLIRKAKEKKPKNINDLINKNMAKGYMEADERGEDRKKRWYVTKLGTDYVSSNFNDNEQNT